MWHCKVVMQQGYIVVTVLIFLQIMAMFGLSGLASTSMLLKTVNHLWQRDETIAQMQRILLSIERHIEVDLMACQIPMVASIELVRGQTEWWQTHACRDNLSGIEYYYVIEALGSDACAVIENTDNKQHVIADYYRVTLLHPRLQPDDLKVLMQATIVTPMNSQQNCSGNRHQVNVGQQMWREI